MSDSILGGVPESSETNAISSPAAPLKGSSPIKRFIREAFKLGVALGIAFIAVVLVIVALLAAYERRETSQQTAEEKRKAARIEPLRKVRRWPTAEVVGTGRAELQTKWGESGPLFRLSISNVGPHGLQFGNGAQFIMKFFDADGFGVLDQHVDANTMSQILDGESVVAYEWQGSAISTPEDYEKIKTWSVLWVGVDVARPRSPARLPAHAGWRERANWRTIRKGMDSDKVRQLLGEPTHVEAGGFTYWIYGGTDWYSHPHVSFYGGTVYGWKEP